MSSVDERVARQFNFPEQYLNPFEMQMVYEYMRTHNVTSQAIWQAIKTGMDSRTFYYLGTGPVANPPPATAAANDADDANDANDADVNAADAAAPAQETPAIRAQRVKSSDRLCHHCSRDYFGNGPFYQWRKSLDDAVLPARALGRSDCWYGRQCRTQHNLGNRGHAERLNHICEKTHR
jgi:hypothetical protein